MQPKPKTGPYHATLFIAFPTQRQRGTPSSYSKVAMIITPLPEA